MLATMSRWWPITWKRLMVGAALAPPPGPNSKTATMPETRPRNVEHLMGQPGDHQAVAFVRGQLARTRCHPRVQGSRQALPNRCRPDEGHPQASTWTKRAGIADLRTAERVQGSASCRSYSAIWLSDPHSQRHFPWLGVPRLSRAVR